jgi:hypothetical protein
VLLLTCEDVFDTFKAYRIRVNQPFTVRLRDVPPNLRLQHPL